MHTCKVLLYRWSVNEKARTVFAGLSKLNKIRSSPSAGLGRQRPDARQELKRGCRLALHVPEHQGSSDKRSVNNWWCSSLEQSHRANGGWKTWTLEKPVWYNITQGSYRAGKVYLKNEIVTVETSFTSGTDLAATYFVLQVLKEKLKRQQTQHLTTRPSRDHSPIFSLITAPLKTTESETPNAFGPRCTTQAQGSNVKAEQVVAINEERAADETADEAEEICSLNAK